MIIKSFITLENRSFLLSEHKQNIQIDRGSEKSFGLVFAVVFFLVGLFPLFYNKDALLWPLIVALVFLLLSYLAPKILSIPNKLWFKLGLALGAVLTPIVMAFVYLITVVPIGLIMRLMGKDILQQKLNKNIESYWIKRDQPMGPMRNQF
jgi:hypothetical protein